MVFIDILRGYTHTHTHPTHTHTPTHPPHTHTHTHTHTPQIPNILEFPPAREFLAIDDQRSALPIYDNETIDEPAERGGVAEADRVELGEKENTTAQITDLDLLKVIGKGSFGKVHISYYGVSNSMFF